MRTLLAGAVAALALLLTACGGDGDDSATDRTTVTATATVTNEVTVTAERSAEAPPPEGTSSEVGDTVTHANGSMQLLAVKDPAPGENYDTPGRGQRFVSIHIEQCTNIGETSSFVLEWIFLDKNGGEYTSIRTMTGWPTPEFPQFVELRPSECKKGWMALELKDGVKFQSVVYRLSGTGETLAEWGL